MVTIPATEGDEIVREIFAIVTDDGQQLRYIADNFGYSPQDIKLFLEKVKLSIEETPLR